MKIIFIAQIVVLTLWRVSSVVHLAGASNFEEQITQTRRDSPIDKNQEIGEIKHRRYTYADRNNRARIRSPDTKLGKFPKSPSKRPHYLPKKLVRPETSPSFLPRYQHGRIWKKRNRRELGRSGSRGVNWAEWGPCNVTCGVGYEKREGRCNSGTCLRGSSVEWRGCVGIKCPNRKSPVITIVWCIVAVFAGFFGGVFVTVLIFQHKWILEKMIKPKKRQLGETKSKSHQEKDVHSLRPPAPIPRQDKEPSYVDVRELHTIKEEFEDNVMDSDDDSARKDEDGYLIPDGGNLDGYHDYTQPATEPEYIDVVE